MSPNQKSNLHRTLPNPFSSALSRRLFCTLSCALSSALLCAGCSNDNQSTEAATLEQTAKVGLQMAFASTPFVDSLVVDCMGADTTHYRIDPEKPYLDMDMFPSEKTVFAGKLYANGTLMQIGEAEAKLTAGSVMEITVQMHALVGFVFAEIPLGFGNPAGVSSGTLKLDDGENVFTYPMEISGTTAVFKSGMLPLQKNYQLEIELKNSEDDVIYNAQDSIYLDENTPVPDLKIKSLRAKVALGFTIADDVELVISKPLPAIRRKPNAGDIVISEFFVIPNTKDSVEFDFIELYNGSTDTLVLDNCTIGKSTLENERVDIKSNVLPPNQLRVLANDTNPNSPDEYKFTEKMITFGKTYGSIVLQCGGTVIDSLYYGLSKSDSLRLNTLPIGSSSGVRKSTQLNIDLYESRSDSASWCLGVPTPGELSFCEN